MYTYVKLFIIHMTYLVSCRTSTSSPSWNDKPRRSSRMGGKVSSNSSMVFPWWSVRILMSWSHSCKGKTMGSTRMAYGFPYPKSIRRKKWSEQQVSDLKKGSRGILIHMETSEGHTFPMLPISDLKPDLKVILDGFSASTTRVFDQLLVTLLCTNRDIILRFYNVHLIRIKYEETACRVLGASTSVHDVWSWSVYTNLPISPAPVGRSEPGDLHTCWPQRICFPFSTCVHHSDCASCP